MNSFHPLQNDELLSENDHNRLEGHIFVYLEDELDDLSTLSFCNFIKRI